jgi:hypothetical protein
MNNDCNIQTLTHEANGLKTTIELPWDADMDTICRAVMAICVNMTFDPAVALNGMATYVVEHMDTKELEELYNDIAGSLPPEKIEPESLHDTNRDID